MKINPLYGTVDWVHQVREKPEGESGKKRRDHGGQSDHPQAQDDEQGEFQKLSDEAIAQAVEAFKADAASQAAGLHATLAGTGPGLRVVLIDGSGHVVRNFTGEEFVKLREAATQDGRLCGKILDQKF